MYLQGVQKVQTLPPRLPWRHRSVRLVLAEAGGGGAGGAGAASSAAL